ncbi:EamA family transporter RarD [Pararhodobacter sp. SW119]|uniref:EamA family transporter RarD n=1 Tax=Pararhodobacter sp. SW119 TaxID=2780075 RepID=UPI001AE03F2F|nr:EamA family transporter RarD [Pararhodobacter sp. SW119]
MTPPATLLGGDTPRGFVFALTAYLLWGFLPLYFRLIDHIGMLEVLAHRVVWSLPIALAVLLALGRTDTLRVALRTPRMLAMGCVTATLISINWGVYIWAIHSGQALEAALGYYINPLFSIFLGAVLLGERLSARQWVAVGLAALAVAVLTFEAGRLPLAALTLTVSWGFYAYFKRSLPIGPNQGFALEVIILMPVALVYLIWLQSQGTLHFVQAGPRDLALLVGCGVITAVPLMIYANGAKLLTLSTIAIMQYIAPTMIFLIAVFLFAEPFGTARAIAFPMIWAALVLYTSEIVGRRLRRPPIG